MSSYRRTIKNKVEELNDDIKNDLQLAYDLFKNSKGKYNFIFRKIDQIETEMFTVFICYV